MGSKLVGETPREVLHREESHHVFSQRIWQSMFFVNVFLNEFSVIFWRGKFPTHVPGKLIFFDFR